MGHKHQYKEISSEPCLFTKWSKKNGLEQLLAGFLYREPHILHLWRAKPLCSCKYARYHVSELHREEAIEREKSCLKRKE